MIDAKREAALSLPHKSGAAWGSLPRRRGGGRLRALDRLLLSVVAVSLIALALIALGRL